MSEENTVTVELSKGEQAVVDSIEKLTVIEANNVATYFKEKYGISAAVAAAPAAAGAAPAAEEDAKSSFNVELKDAGGQKIAVIKVIREITGLGLGEAKALADNGGTIKENVKKEDAEAMKKQFEDAGATVELA
ncbi:50S ribosomal protein L7/L12 [bacterium]|nr:50S ribosomal protein L7/L12 [bacterium]NCQ55102.1 50S ribosomal protein L7/L12 [Candidatus Parcubacteria bacterium]NCS68057.1 50S ribosomal protein L7/L12 [Candidatus Peregrinibacteria bacterium]NCS96092.1 50S ribosomal protein L7/L12 [bacterium]